jgi:quercetin dioxygenase-like cupin family protein
MEKKEPYATQEEYNRSITHYRNVPLIELVPGIQSHIVSAERIMLSFLTAQPNSYMPNHRHESEQLMVILDGTLDLAIEGKLYHMEKGDVVTLPSNVDHAAYISDKGVTVIDIFSPPRQDFIAKLEQVIKKKKT